MKTPTYEEVAAVIPPEEIDRFRARFESAESNEEREAVMKDMGRRYMEFIVRKTIIEPVAEKVMRRGLDGINRQVGVNYRPAR